jgi:hypothetical protein
MVSQSRERDDTSTADSKTVVPYGNGTVEIPQELADTISLSGWAESLYNGAPYAEPDEGYLSRLLIRQTLEATSPEQVFTPNDLDGLQKIVGNAPGAGTGPIEINGLYVARSSMTEGAPTYMILDYVSLETGATRKTTTGATQLQAQILRLVAFGIWPIGGQIKRTERQDKGGRYLFWLFPPD